MKVNLPRSFFLADKDSDEKDVFVFNRDDVILPVMIINISVNSKLLLYY